MPPTNSASSRVPQRLFYGEAMSCLVSSLHIAHQREVAALAADSSSPSTLLGYRIPSFQRKNDRWSRTQQVRFIESMYMGTNIGSFMVNIPTVSADESLHNVLLDGLQRMTAVKAYFNGDFGVAGGDGKLRLWTELERQDQAHLFRITLPWVLTNYRSQELMIEAYERHNFGGTQHTVADFETLQAHRAGPDVQSQTEGESETAGQVERQRSA